MSSIEKPYHFGQRKGESDSRNYQNRVAFTGLADDREPRHFQQPRAMPQTPVEKAKIHKVMHEAKEGTLHSGSKTGPLVENHDQAVAIALSEARKAKEKEGATDEEEDEDSPDKVKTTAQGLFGGQPKAKKVVPPSDSGGQHPDVFSTNPEKFAALWNDDSKWKHVRAVPVFDAHTEKYSLPGPDGRPQEMTENFDRPRLERIAANCNRLVATGNPIGLSAGHTLDKAPESSQPETIGYAHNYRVGMHPTLRREVIYHDEKYFPDKYELARTLPYRSVERWRPNAETGGDYFKPVALLRREPRRHLGPVAYQVGTNTVIRYSMEYAMPATEAPPGNATPAPAVTAPPPAQTPNPPVAPVEDYSQMEPSPKDKALHEKLCYAHPHLGKLVKYMESNPNWPGMGENAPKGVDDPNAAGQTGQPTGQENEPSHGGPIDKMAMGMGAPSGSNMPPPRMPPTKPEQMRMSADTSEVVRYQQEHAELRAEIESLKKGERVARYAADYSRLEDEGYPVNAVEELTRAQDYTQEQHDAHVADIKKYGAANLRPQIGVRGIVRIDGLPEPMTAAAGGQKMTQEQMEKALQYQAEHPGTTYPQAMRYAMTGQSPVRSA